MLRTAQRLSTIISDRSPLSLASKASFGGLKGISSSSIAAKGSQKLAKVVVITGPTAVGKTEVSLSLAEKLGGEVISADSVQVYRGLDIGSAKISPEERRGIPHHLLDILDPNEEFSAGDFFERSRAAIKDIVQRGKFPIIVGGTGFYLRWCIHGKPDTPTSSAEGTQKAKKFIAKVLDEAKKQKGAELTGQETWDAYAAAIEIQLGDPESAKRLRQEVNNEYRLFRMVEILLSTGKPLSELNLDRTADLDYDFRCFFLNRNRLELYDRIGLRCEQMVAGGILREAQGLLDQGLAPGSNCASKSIGYRQAMEFLQKWQDCPERPTAKDIIGMVSAMQAKSRRLCQDQIAWFRNDPLFRWIDVSQPKPAVVDELISLIDSEYHQGALSQGRARLTKEEAQSMKRYVYQQQLLCQPEVQSEVFSMINSCQQNPPTAKEVPIQQDNTKRMKL